MKKICNHIMALAITIAFTSTGIYAQELEEIIVTATKREANLQDVPVSVSVISGDKIEAAAIHDFLSLSTYIPNFSVTENAISTIASMRGVGIGANQSFENSVGLFVDGVHLSKGRQYRTGLFDVERVEVLRGPQGTLFGKNTLAGAVNVISAKANVGDEFGGRIAIAGEENGGQLVEGNIHGTVAKNFAMRIAFKDRKDDGYIDNVYNGGSGPTTDETMFRISGSWEPSDDLRIDFKHTDGDHVRTGSSVAIKHWEMAMPPTATSGLAFTITNMFHPALPAAVAAGEFIGYRDENMCAGSTLCLGLNTEGTDTQTQDTSINLTYNFGDGYTFKSTTGQAEYEYADGIDADFAAIVLVSRDDWSSYDQTSQEFSISSPQDGDFTWIAGAYWDSQEQDIERLIDLDGTIGGVMGIFHAMGAAPDPSILTIPLATLTAMGLPMLYQNNSANNPTAAYLVSVGVLPGTAADYQTMFDHATRIGYWNQKTESKAVYFQGTMQMSDSLSVTAGVRYVEEAKHIVAGTCLGTDTTGLQTCNSNAFLAGIMGASFDTWAHNFDNVPERNTDHVLPSLVIKKDLSDNHMIYASFSKGYKSGGYNAADDQNPEFTLVGGARVPNPTVPGIGFEYDDETAVSYEIGGKHLFPNSKLQLNWAAAHADYDNQQVSTFVGLGFVVGNAASSDVDTIEVDLLWQATPDLRIGVNAAYLDAKFDSFPAAACTEKQLASFRGMDPTGNPYNPTGYSYTNIHQSNYGADLAIGNCKAIWNAAGFMAVGNQDLSGEPRGPGKYNGAVFADYTRDIGSDMQFFLSLDVSFFDDYTYAGDADPIDAQEASQLINVRAGVRADKWEAMVYGRNITDEIIANGGFDVPLTSGAHAMYMAPREVWGARLTYNF